MFNNDRDTARMCEDRGGIPVALRNEHGLMFAGSDALLAAMLAALREAEGVDRWTPPPYLERVPRALRRELDRVGLT